MGTKTVNPDKPYPPVKPETGQGNSIQENDKKIPKPKKGK